VLGVMETEKKDFQKEWLERLSSTLSIPKLTV
jgi:hypothetical protein